MATLVLCLSCTKRETSADVPPSHPEHGHHGHGHGAELNEHGYKGHTFEDPQAWTERFESPERAAWQRPDEVIASLAVAADAKIADLGAGTGYFAVRFAAAAPQGQVYAVDIEPKMVEWLAQRATDEGHANLEAVLGEADEPKLPEPVDLVFMCNVFHHLAQPQAYFQAVAKQLRPGARVIIVDFRKDAPEHAPGPPQAMRMSPEQISEHMQAAGFRLARNDLELLEYQYVLEFVPA
ncbi:Demethylrebeccamycin-D-glucose O-methyltransferase [Enhygromyxa salina]|uniref:Demethylrebeccamycin-D-glucose O-methyltransferase n=1 Tax=Enhygromyxa salina TaxID=215803 RepID=A0A2S9YUV1_9BACT|nr:Demethylrebeccamycin-D-glucose O-methyltransferase [Enhygromyxa salina]